jgi:hypothetical protein
MANPKAQPRLLRLIVPRQFSRGHSDHGSGRQAPVVIPIDRCGRNRPAVIPTEASGSECVEEPWRKRIRASPTEMKRKVQHAVAFDFQLSTFDSLTETPDCPLATRVLP